MGLDVTIAICTYGDDPYWQELAKRRALPSAKDQGLPHGNVVMTHSDTLAAARNKALDFCESEFIIFLDADDELTPGYVQAMDYGGDADLRAPAVEYVRGGVAQPAYVPRVAGHDHDCTTDCLPQGNWLVIGTCARTSFLKEVYGFKGWPVYEDWCLWWRAVRAGATAVAVPGAVYRAYVRGDSRNRAMPIEERNHWHHKIVAAVLA